MGSVDGQATAAGTLRVAVACSPRAGVAVEVDLVVAGSATAIDAVRASGLLERFPELAVGAPSIGIWGRTGAPDALLREGDRVELYRPLTLDPLEARRLRARKLRAGIGR